MKKIVIIGAGAMGSAFTVPCVDNDNDVTLIGTHLENELITSIKKNKNFHPTLKTNLPSKLKICNRERCRCNCCRNKLSWNKVVCRRNFKIL